jgi:hypothetical protein
MTNQYQAWNFELIDDLFEPDIADAIKRIPISQSELDDYWAWSATPNGIYSSKSGYKEAKIQSVLKKSASDDYSSSSL